MRLPSTIDVGIVVATGNERARAGSFGGVMARFLQIGEALRAGAVADVAAAGEGRTEA